MTWQHHRLVAVLGCFAWLVLVLVVVQACSPRPPAARTVTPIQAAPDQYVGADTCMGCHEPAHKMFSQTRMGRLFLKQPRNDAEKLGCENCHGPGKAHAEQGGGKGKDSKIISFSKHDPTPVAVRNQMCVACHQQGEHLFWTGSAHESADVACTSCHVVMQDITPKSQLAKPTVLDTCGTCHLRQRAQQFRSSHMPLREGKMTCTSCHSPHGSVTPALLKENSLNDTCFTCHAEKRGPFLWEHAPVVESCANCHDPHGSNHERMLKISKPRLCQQCHIETRHPTTPYGRDPASLKFVLGRSCASCHVNIHGSNHPSGFAFTR